MSECPSGKTRYVDWLDAMEVKDGQWRRHNKRPERKPPSERAYRCPKCGDWHLTSRPLTVVGTTRIIDYGKAVTEPKLTREQEEYILRYETLPPKQTKPIP